MNNKLTFFFIVLLAFGLGAFTDFYYWKQYAPAPVTNVTNVVEPVHYAVVDVQRVVSSSSDVTRLKEDQERKLLALQEWIKGPNEALEKEKDEKKKAELAEKFQRELEEKRQEIQLNYIKDLQRIDSKITGIIETAAKAEGFSMSFSKGSLLHGGTDITDKVLELVK